MPIRGGAGSLAILLLTGSSAAAADASASSQEVRATPPPAAPVLSASSSFGRRPSPLPRLACATGGLFLQPRPIFSASGQASAPSAQRSRHRRLRAGVDEAVLNLSGGLRQNAQEAGQVALQAAFDLQKSLGLEGASVLVTLVDRWGRNAATDAGIPALQLINEVYGRGNIVRLAELA